jgi:hypothetical protein
MTCWMQEDEGMQVYMMNGLIEIKETRKTFNV